MSLKRIILHIGRHKSGTSSLQHFLSSERESFLKENGILYPSSGIIGKQIAHHGLAFQCNINLSDGRKLKSIADNIKRELSPQIHTLLLSSEAFQNLPKYGRLKFFLKQFEGVEIEVVCYFREFADYMISSFRQATQNQSQFRSFDFYLNQKHNMKKFLKGWRNLGHLKARWFHRDFLLDQDLVKDFLMLINLEHHEVPRRNMNQSIGGNILFFKMAANFSGKNILTYRDLSILAGSQKRFSEPFFIDRKIIEKVRWNNKYNKVLIRELGDVPFRYWDEHTKIPDVERMDEDLEVVKSEVNVDCSEFKGMVGRASKYWF